MIDFSIAAVPVAVVALANFIVSWLYYSPLTPWFKTWQLSVGVDPNKKEMTEEDKKMFPVMMGGAVVSSFLLAYGLQVLVHSLKAEDFFTGACLGLVVWAAFALTHSLNTLFEGRKPVVLVINNGAYLVTYAVFGGILAVWK